MLEGLVSFSHRNRLVIWILIIGLTISGLWAFSVLPIEAFPDVLNDDGDFIGFDVIIGNPPYIQIQHFSGQDMQVVLENKEYETFEMYPIPPATTELFIFIFSINEIINPTPKENNIE